MSSSSAWVGFWPRERMTVPSSFVVMVPSPSVHWKQSQAMRDSHAYHRKHESCEVCQQACREENTCVSMRQPHSKLRLSYSPLSKRENASLNSAVVSLHLLELQSPISNNNTHRQFALQAGKTRSATRPASMPIGIAGYTRTLGLLCQLCCTKIALCESRESRCRRRNVAHERDSKPSVRRRGCGVRDTQN